MTSRFTILLNFIVASMRSCGREPQQKLDVPVDASLRMSMTAPACTDDMLL